MQFRKYWPKKTTRLISTGELVHCKAGCTSTEQLLSTVSCMDMLFVRCECTQAVELAPL